MPGLIGSWLTGTRLYLRWQSTHLGISPSLPSIRVTPAIVTPSPGAWIWNKPQHSHRVKVVNIPIVHLNATPTGDWGACEPIECYKDCVILEGWSGTNRIRLTLNTMSVASMETNFILLLPPFLVATIQHPQKSTKCSKNDYFSFHYNTPPRKMFYA